LGDGKVEVWSGAKPLGEFLRIDDGPSLVVWVELRLVVRVQCVLDDAWVWTVTTVDLAKVTILKILAAEVLRAVDSILRLLSTRVWSG